MYRVDLLVACLLLTAAAQEDQLKEQPTGLHTVDQPSNSGVSSSTLELRYLTPYPDAEGLQADVHLYLPCSPDSERTLLCLITAVSEQVARDARASQKAA